MEGKSHRIPLNTKQNIEVSQFHHNNACVGSENAWKFTGKALFFDGATLHFNANLERTTKNLADLQVLFFSIFLL